VDYQAVLAYSWRLTWQRKGLWLLGVIAVLDSVLSRLGLRVLLNGGGIFNADTGAGWASPEVTGKIIPVAALVLALFLLLWTVGTIAEGGLIAAANPARQAGALARGEAWDAGRRYLWRLLAIDTLVFLPLFLLILAVAILLLLSVTAAALLAARNASFERLMLLLGGTGMLCILPLTVLTIPVALLSNLLRVLAFRAAIVDEDGARESVRRAWRMLRTQPGSVLLMAVLLWVFVSAVGALLALVVLPFELAPPVRTSLPSLFGAGGVWLIFLLASLVDLVPRAVAFNFSTVTWTTAYCELQREEADTLPVAQRAGES
jgi:hypothetical protein